MKHNRLGVDVGGVIISRQNDHTDTSFFGHNYLKTTAVEEVFECLRQLREGGFEVFIVSKCGANVQRKTLEWMAHHRFFERTGIASTHVHFCRTRPEKAPICERHGITHFVDDRLDVLDYLKTVEQLYLFQPNDADYREWQRGHRAHCFTDWPSLTARLLQELAICRK